MYKPDLINAMMGAKRLTNEKVAKAAHLATGTVSSIRNGNPNVNLPSLRAVADVLGLDVEITFTPKAEVSEPARS
ncbi:MAG TPA: helix-turn-helix transcriptional regulator [Pyrinomonadaceae bacterium]|jgi:transcriptional regulator with XRE-family HTH domain